MKISLNIFFFLLVGFSLNAQKFSETPYSIFFIKDDGTLWCWGNNNYYHLGSESINRNKPVIYFPNTKWKSVAANDGTHYGIKTDGSLWAWDVDYHHYYWRGSSNTERKKITLRRIGLDTNWKYITTDGGIAAGLKTDGTLWTWEYNIYGELGIGITKDKSIPTKLGKDKNWKGVKRVGLMTCAIKSDGTIWAWGSNYYGLFGKNRIESKIPIQINNDTDWKTLEGGEDHIIALKQDGSLWSWGNNNLGQLGIGAKSTKYAINPVRIGSDNDWTWISVGSYLSYAIKSNGSIWSWGRSFHGNNGHSMINEITYLPIQIGNKLNWSKVFTGSFNTIALKSDKSVWIWGSNDYGLLGLGTDAFKSTPVRIASDVGWKEISSNGVNTYGIKLDGTLWGWGGRNNIGINDTCKFVSSIPVQIGSETNWKSISYDLESYVAIKSDGTLWRWDRYLDAGCNYSKDLNYTISQIGTETNWNKIFGGYKNIFAIKSNRSLWGWGENSSNSINYTHGAIGNPTQIGTDLNWLSIGVGYGHTIGLKSNGTLWSWGSNGEGSLGLSSNNNSLTYSTPQRIGNNSNWTAISTDQDFNYAFNSSGSLWTWGKDVFNYFPAYLLRNHPIKVNFISNIKTICTYFRYAAAIKTDGTLWTWGENNFGNLGDGTRIDNKIGVKVGEDNDWDKICRGDGYSTFAIKKDGSLWAWGNNLNGTLGIGEFGYTSTPTLLFPILPPEINHPDVIQGNTESETFIPPVDPDAKGLEPYDPPKPAEDEIFTAVEQQAEFPGGPRAFETFLQKNLRYPSSAQRENVGGKVYVQFVVNTDGTIQDVQVLKSVGFGCDEEAVRIIKSVPRWTPGKQSGRAVRSRFTQPIYFILPPKNDKVTLKIGDQYGGGIVFYVDPITLKGLVVTKEDVRNGSTEWGCYCQDIKNTKTEVGSGQNNTKEILAQCFTSQDIPNWSAKIVNDLVKDGFDDWYLPSKDELNLIYQNLHLKGLGNFSKTVPYWSSTQASYGSCGLSGGGWSQNFGTGEQIQEYKRGYAGTGAVRAIRSF